MHLRPDSRSLCKGEELCRPRKRSQNLPKGSGEKPVHEVYRANVAKQVHAEQAIPGRRVSAEQLEKLDQLGSAVCLERLVHREKWALRASAAKLVYLGRRVNRACKAYRACVVKLGHAVNAEQLDQKVIRGQ